jgi:uroporphyrinogen-III decarboxylase
MRFSLHIDIPPERIRDSARRIAACDAGAPVDRAPVGFCIVARYFAHALGADYDEFIRDPETHYSMLLAFAKYHAENIRDDFLTGPVVEIGPFFDNVVNASAFGAEVVRPRGETPRAVPVIHSIDAMDGLEVPGPDAGLWGTMETWWRRFEELARETEITIGGEPGRVVPAPLSIGGEGPHMIAIDLVGTDFYWWQVEYPEQCRRFLSRITDGMIRAERHFRGVDPRPRITYGIAEDSAQAMSARMFDDFCVPFDDRLYAEFGAGLADGRGMHMCGRSTHLHDSLVRKLRISSFNAFGSLVDPRTAAQNLGGRCRLRGNVDPLLILTGTKDQVKSAARRCLEAMAPCGGYTLGDGANICPGTSLENLNAMVEAAEEYGPIIPAARPAGRAGGR